MRTMARVFVTILILACSFLANAAVAAEINVLSREEGSGTRGAFVELFGLMEKIDGKNLDQTSDSAEITNSTAVMMASVAGDKNSIGYISLGSLNDSIKPLAIDGVSPSVAAIKNGEYKIARPFNLVMRGESSELARDFIEFILSREGQAIVEKAGYIGADSANSYVPINSYAPGQGVGKIVVAGSSSVTPVMEKLKEGYLEQVPGAIIEIQMSDSTTGIAAVRDGISDIGMSSRDLRESELKNSLEPVTIARDGIAVIVNKDNPLNGLAADMVKKIFSGKIRDWSDLVR